MELALYALYTFLTAKSARVRPSVSNVQFPTYFSLMALAIIAISLSLAYTPISLFARNADIQVVLSALHALEGTTPIFSNPNASPAAKP